MDVADLNKKILSYIDHQTKNFITFNSNTNNYYSNKDILIKISNKLKIKPNYSLKKINPGESLYPIYKKNSKLKEHLIGKLNILQLIK